LFPKIAEFSAGDNKILLNYLELNKIVAWQGLDGWMVEWLKGLDG
jgi:hypothetical protein